MDPYVFPNEITHEKKRNRSKGTLKQTKIVIRTRKYMIEMNFEEILERIISWLKIIRPSLTDKQLSGHAFKQLGLPHIMGTLSCVNLKKELRRRNGRIDLNLIDPLLLLNFSKKIRIFVRKATEKRYPRNFPNMDNLPELEISKNDNLLPVDDDKDEENSEIYNSEEVENNSDEIMETIDNESVNSDAVYKDLCYSGDVDYSSDEDDTKPWRTDHLKDIESISPIKFIRELNYLNISYKCTTPLLFQDITEDLSEISGNSPKLNESDQIISLASENNDKVGKILQDIRNNENVIEEDQEEVTPKSFKKILRRKQLIVNEKTLSPKYQKLSEYENDVTEENSDDENEVSPKGLKNKQLSLKLASDSSPIKKNSKVNSPKLSTGENYENENRIDENQELLKTKKKLSLGKQQLNTQPTDEEEQPLNTKVSGAQNIESGKITENKAGNEKVSFKKKLSLKKQKKNDTNSFDINVINNESPNTNEQQNIETNTMETIPSPTIPEERTNEAELTVPVEDKEVSLKPLKKKLCLSKIQSIDEVPTKEAKSSNTRELKISEAQNFETTETKVEKKHVSLKKKLRLKKKILKEPESCPNDIVAITESPKVIFKQNFETMEKSSPPATNLETEVTVESKKKRRKKKELINEIPLEKIASPMSKRVSDGMPKNYEQMIEEPTVINKQDKFECTPMKNLSNKTKVSVGIELKHYEEKQEKKHKMSDGCYTKSVGSKVSESDIFIKPFSTKPIKSTTSTMDSIKYIGIKKRKNRKRKVEESSYIGESICTELDNVLMDKLPPTSTRSELESIYKDFKPSKLGKSEDSRLTRSSIKRITVNSLPKEDSISKVCRYLENLPGGGPLSTNVINSSQSTDDVESNAPSSSCGSVLRKVLDTDADSE